MLTILKKTFSLLLTVCVVLLLVLAVYVSVGRQLLPYAENYRADVEASLSSSIGQEVQIGSLRGAWSRFNPVLTLDRVLIFPANPSPTEQVFLLDAVTLELDVWASLLARHLVFADVDVSGPELTLAEQNDGSWQLRGFETSSDTPMDVAQLFDMVKRVSSFSLSNLRLTLRRADGRTSTFERGRGTLQNRGAQHFLNFDAWQDETIGPLSFAAELTGDRVDELNGRLYILLPDNDYSEIISGSYSDAVTLTSFDGSGEFWVDIRAGKVGSLQGNTSIRQLNVAPMNGENTALLNDFSARFFVEKNADDSSWNVSLNELTFQWGNLNWRDSDINVTYQNQQALHLIADRLNLSIAAGLASHLNVLSAQADTQLAEYNLRGELANVDLQWTLAQEAGADRLLLTSNLEDVSVSARGAAPGLWGVDGYTEISFDGANQHLTGMAEVDSSRFRIQLPNLFNDVWEYDYVNGRVKFALDFGAGQHVQLASSIIVAESESIDGRVQFSTEFRRTLDGERSSVLDLMVGALAADVADKSLYLPTAPAVKDNLRNVMTWLDAALIGGRATDSGLIFRGSVLEGSTALDRTMQMYFNVDEGTILFDSRWPALERLNGLVLIDNNDVDVQVASGESLSIGFDATNATIRPNDKGPGSWLSVAGTGRGPAQQGLRYLQATPATQGFGDYLAVWQMEGMVDLHLNLAIPLGVPEAQPQVGVGLDLRDNILYIPEYELRFDNLMGRLNYSTATGLSSEGVSASLFDEPVLARVKSEIDTGRNSVTSVELTGKVDVASLRRWPKQSKFVVDLLSRTQGSMDYLARLDITQPTSDGSAQAGILPQRRLKISSSLEGINVGYPAPFNKQSEQAMPLDLTIDFHDTRQDLQVVLGELTSMNIGLADGAIRNGLVFLGRRDSGVSVRRLNPGAPGLDVLGTLQDVNYDDWISVLRKVADGSQGSASGSGNFASLREAINAVDVTIVEAVAFGQSVENLNLQIASEDSSWKISLASDVVTGEILVPYSADAPLDVQLSHLHLPAIPEKDAADLPLVLNSDMSVELPAVEKEERIDPLLEFDPRALPPMNFKAESITRGDADYGQWQFSLQPTKDGAEFSNLIVEARGLRAGGAEEEARFTWNFDGENHHSYLNAVLSASNLATVLSDFGYAPSLESTTAVFHTKLDWPGSPAFFSGDDLSGDIDLRITDGRFQGGGSGNGALKLISIINFDALVRRLRFSDDLLRRGLSYEQIYGAMTLNKGIVHIVDRLQIVGPASLFQVAGSLDLKQQTIDGSLYITLPLSDNIPWMSGIAVLNNLINWQVAVGVFLFDQIFGDQVDSLTSAQYTLKGPWEGLEPRLNQVFGTPPAAVAAPPASATSPSATATPQSDTAPQ